MSDQSNIPGIIEAIVSRNAEFSDGTVTREELVTQIGMVISGLLEKDPEGFFRLMYRLDIPEEKLKELMQDVMNGIVRLALFIYENQIRKSLSRKRTPFSIPEDPDLQW